MADRTVKIVKLTVPFDKRFPLDSGDEVVSAEYTDLVPIHHHDGEITYQEGATIIVLRGDS